MEKQIFVQKLIEWYLRHHRDLPWRNTRDPYYIWLSEVILQQTRVKQGLPYYLKFVETFPTLMDLAHAEEREVLRLWQGLGYYSRARNMHSTAKTVANEHKGVFPNKYIELLKLKGIGTYTAAAIASFAFNEKAAVLDGNVFRVLARVFGITTDIASSQGKKEFTKLASDLLPDHQIDIYNQAIMEFGAVQCTPVNPDCLFCPLQIGCIAYLNGRQRYLPVKTKKINVKERFFYYYIIQQGDSVLMKERTQKDIWMGLFDFPLLEAASILPLDELMKNEIMKELLNKSILEEESEIFTHVLTHQRIRVKFLRFYLQDEFVLSVSDFVFYSKAEIKQLPKPILIDNYLNSWFF